MFYKYPRVIVTRVVQVVSHAGGNEYSDFFDRHYVPKFAQMDHSIHHLSDTEAVTEVVEWIVSVILLDTKLKTEKYRLEKTLK